MSMDQNTINSANRPITSGNSFQINTLTPFIGDGEFTDYVNQNVALDTGPFVPGKTTMTKVFESFGLHLNKTKNDFTISGNLYVNKNLIFTGSATKIYSEDLTVKDNIIQLGYVDYGYYIGNIVDFIDGTNEVKGEITNVYKNIETNENNFSTLL